jgi:hypothetical protein
MRQTRIIDATSAPVLTSLARTSSTPKPMVATAASRLIA